MNNLYEYILIGLVILYQFRLFFKTRTSLKQYQYALPDIDECAIEERVSKEKPDEASLDIKDAVDEDVVLEDSTNQGTPVELGKTTYKPQIISPYQGDLFNTILHAINTYLLRNVGAAADFHLIKDIVERHIDTLEQEIEYTIPLPLYLGLMGTMLGIVMGLFGMPDMNIDASQFSSNTGTGINALLDGVKIAMIASFTGLCLTVFNTLKFNKVRKSLEQKKNLFYSFIQTSLLPVLSQSILTNIYQLQFNLSNFSESFSAGVHRLEGVVQQNFEALHAQNDALEKLKDLDVTTLAKYNITVFSEIKESFEQLETLGQYLRSNNSFIKNARKLNDRVVELIDRTEQFEHIATNINGSLHETKRLQQYLNSHFTKIEQSGTLVQRSIADVDEALSVSVDQLKQHTTKNLDAFREFTTQQQSLLNDTLEVTKDAMIRSMRISKDSMENLDYKNALGQGFSAFLNQEKQTVSQFESSLSKMHKVSTATLKAIRELKDEISPPTRLGQVERWLTFGLKILLALLALIVIGILIYEAIN